MSIVIGGLVTALVEGGVAYTYREWAARFGITFGAFFGASLTSYFSASVEDRHTNLFKASITTMLLFAILVIPEQVRYGVNIILDITNDDIGKSLLGAAWTIGMGVLLSPVIAPLTRFIEASIERFSELNQNR